MNPKKLKQLKKRVKKQAGAPYIQQLMKYRDLFKDDPQILVLINNVLESDRLLAAGLAPQQLPVLEIPDDFQDHLFERINQQYAMGDPAGDAAWNQLSAALPKVDQLLRNFRDYIEDQYGMWAYISAPFLKDLADFTGSDPVDFLVDLFVFKWIGRPFTQLLQILFPVSHICFSRLVVWRR